MYDLDTTHVVLSGAGGYKKLHTIKYINITYINIHKY